MTSLQRFDNNTSRQKDTTMMEKFYKFARAITLAPVIAMISLTATAIFRPDVIGTAWHYAYMMLFLGILPLLAYPLQPYIPRFADKGRSGQRTLAMLFAVAGYLLNFAVSLLAQPTRGMWLICLEYLLSGVLILVFNKVLHIKLSAHGCGSAGPVALMLYFGMPIPALVMAAMTARAYVSSVRAGHHTMGQLLGGSAVSVVLLAVLAAVM